MKNVVYFVKRCPLMRQRDAAEWEGGTNVDVKKRISINTGVMSMCAFFFGYSSFRTSAIWELFRLLCTSVSARMCSVYSNSMRFQRNGGSHFNDDAHAHE